eukprot:CAMPEP_0198219874 /NCGR_PEP_ID=MMETSP1445-20131203/76556_1 /TAXON_ID=36898 /ORGANISM="Pyramimonas sp., Strain CCMP2087" /LENGTH=439 /DNA_ID=CAMNT_0043897443 /DNA_START=378 /DNA_END=1693 /DNA_ORIENTATION=+
MYGSGKLGARSQRSQRSFTEHAKPKNLASIAHDTRDNAREAIKTHHEVVKRTLPALQKFMGRGARRSNKESKATGIKGLYERLSIHHQILFRALCVLILYYGVVAAIYVPFKNNWTTHGDSENNLIDALYFASTTISTVGYGDITPIGHDTQILTGFLLLVALMFIAHELGAAVEVIREKASETRRNAILKHASRKKKAHPMDSQFIALGFKAEKEVTGNPFNFSDGTFKVVGNFVGIGMNIFITTMAFYLFEDYGFRESMYGAIATITTVGYGDVSFSRPGTRLFASFWLLVTPINTLFFINGFVEGISEKYEEMNMRDRHDEHDDADVEGDADKSGAQDQGLDSPEKRVLANGEVANRMVMFVNDMASREIASDQSDITVLTATQVVPAPETRSVLREEAEFVLERWAQEKQFTDKQMLSLIRKMRTQINNRDPALA